MISAPTGGNPNVIGSSMATVATVPMPGSTPTSVPTSAPSRQKPILYGMRGDRETERKVGKKFTHDGFFCSVPGPKLKRQLQQIDE